MYVTSTLPFGSGEPFVIPEIRELARREHDVTIVPMRPQGLVVVHDDIRPFLSSTLARPLICREIALAALREGMSSPRITLKSFRHLLQSRSPRILAKNIAVFPKGLWLGRRLRELQVDHLHAHWASTSSTMALIASEVSGVPWSLTAHRWDIRENNLLQVKASQACFIRAISRRGARSLAAQVVVSGERLRVLHMGIALPNPPQTRQRPAEGTDLAVVCIADFVEVKGHRCLVDALRMLRDRGTRVRVDLVGDGPLRRDVEGRVASAGLADRVSLLGTVPHARLLDDLRVHRWNVAVLPSIVTKQAEEGVPVSLIEAMGAGVPVVSTRTGSIPELLVDGAGLLVDGGDPVGLADALARLADDPDLRRTLAENGLRRVHNGFNIVAVTSHLVECFEECART
jgi:glycosyltransferase involved in cell wall biosynthesis